MTGRVSINTSIAGHILLDAELKGRFGVQGNTFSNTFGYLNQYFNTLKTVPPQLNKLRIAMAALVEREDMIIRLNSSIATSPSLLDVTNHAAMQILNLTVGADFMLPGGWQNASDGHAMIYQFQKIADGDLLFSIYNAGAGLEYHEKVSKTTNEHFYPVLSYKIPTTPLNGEIRELSILIQRLLLPQLPAHPLCHQKKFNAETLYQNIEKSMLALQASHIAQFNERITTGGQISGTCSQRSIHQMLKVNFDMVSDYQRFIFEFKRYALKDFIATHSPCSPPIADFIHEAIKNNLKILQEPNVFSDEKEQAAVVSELIQLQQGILSQPQKRSKSQFPLITYHYKLNSWQKTVFKTSSNNQIRNVFHHPTLPTLALEKIDALVCLPAPSNEDQSIWFVDQIENVVVQLPLPTRPTVSGGGISPYDQMNTPSQLQDMGDKLETLQKIYTQALSQLIGNSQLPHQLVTLCSLLALRDYVDVLLAKLHVKPAFSAIQRALGNFLDGFRDFPFFATNHPIFDQRLVDLMHLYKRNGDVGYKRNGYYINYYSELLGTEPELKAELQRLYLDEFEANQSTLHVTLRIEQLTELYYLFEQIATPEKLALLTCNTAVNFDSLIKKIHQQVALETFFVSCLNPFLDSAKKNDRVLKLSLCSEKNRIIEIETPAYSSRIADGTFTAPRSPHDITQHKYNLKPSHELNALLKDGPPQYFFQTKPGKMSGNRIQLSSHDKQSERVITKEDFYTRELFHLRSSPANQIDFTLDYFSNLLNKLSDPNTQCYLEANIFEPGLLYKMLEADVSLDKTTFVDRFDRFIKKGLQYFATSEGTLSVPSIFFVRLRFYFDRYAARYKPEHYLERLSACQNHLTTLVHNETDLQMLERIHTYLFLTILARYELTPDTITANPAAFAQAFHSYCFIQAKNNHYTHDDTAANVERLRAEMHFKGWLQRVPTADIEPLIKPMLKNIGVFVPECTVLGIDHLFTVQSKDKSICYTVDATVGRVFKDSWSFSGTPMIIRYHPMARRLGLLHETSCFRSLDGATLKFPHQHSATRIKITGEELTIQKEWVINNKKEWYELQPLTRQHKLVFKLRVKSTGGFNEHLPKLIRDGSMMLWSSGEQIGSILVQNNQAMYQVNDQLQLEQLNTKGMGTGYVLATAPAKWRDELTCFESPKFFSVHTDKHNQGTVDFIRYGLSLIINDDHVILPETAYQLFSPSVLPLGENVAALYFTDGINHQCIVPVQAFYVQPNAQHEIGDYYQLKHDTSGYIAEQKLKQKWEDDSKAEINQPMWHYAGSAKTITYMLINGMPKPETAADTLYLCYLYLAQHQIDKAWMILDDIQQFDGNLDELAYLSWIINALPVVLDDDDAKATINTPRYIACQLKALACYTDFLAQDKNIIIPSDATIDMTTANGHYQAICLKQYRLFNTLLPYTIYRLYSQLLTLNPHLDEMYTLDDFACKCLLNYYDSTMAAEDEPKALGSLGYEKRRLSLKTVAVEYNQLLAIKNASPQHFSPKFNRRMANIDNELRLHLDVMKKSTIIQAVSIDLSLSGCTLKSALLPDKNSVAKQSYDKWSSHVFDITHAGTQSEAMAALSSAINDDFIRYFPHYMCIATDVKNPYREALLAHCELYLKAHRHIPLNKQDTNVPYLTNCIYRVIHNPKCLDSYTKYGINMAFDNAVPLIHKCRIPSLQVYQAVDVFQDVLATSHEIWADLIKKTPLPMPMKPIVFHQEIPFTMRALIEKSAALLPTLFHDCFDAYQKAEHHYQCELKALLTTLGDKPNSVAIAQAEQLAGDLSYACVQKQRKIAEEMLAAHETQFMLKKQAAKFESALELQKQHCWIDILNLANRDLAQLYTIKLAAKQRHLLTKNELIKLYLRADCANYLEQTGLTPQHCEQLHTLIHHVISIEVQQQHVKRLLTALTPPFANTPDLTDVARILMSENGVHAKHDPALMVFQYEENILLRPRQIEALAHLLSSPDLNDAYQFNNAVEKVIMGGGKSKVLLPLLAAKKAMGLNLVVIEVPRALLATNHVDLNHTSKRLFNQKAHRFEFDRDSDCSARRLQAIHQQFVDTMIHKHYLVTTGESIQSLELKYLELLLFRPSDESAIEHWKKQVYWAGKITALLKQSGDVVIDELHQGLLLKKKLNYTVGEQQAIQAIYIHHSSQLYQFVDLLTQEHLNDHLITLNERMEYHWPHMITSLAHHLIYHQRSPLRVYVDCLHANYGDGVLLKLVTYLNNHAVSSEIIAAETALKDAFAFYKEQLSLLPQTLSRHHKEHYGPSKLATHSALKRTLAIPYAANDKPNERSRFGNPLETINYTIQSVLHDGLNKALLIEIIEQWQAEARHELLINKQYQYLEQTSTAAGVALYLKGTGKKNQGIDFTLKMLNIHNKTQMDIVFEHLQHHKTLLFALLETHILKQISVEAAILHSDAYNHVDIYHSCQGLSGTPWNHTTYHQNLQYNYATSLGTDGYIQRVLTEKNTLIHALQFTDIDAFLQKLYATIAVDKSVRAVIDISATFAGLSNLDVAKAMAVFSFNHEQPIRYVLYFNDDDILCALDVARPMRAAIVLGTSDAGEIDRKLNCTPIDRLTYYDQSHTIGTDLKQGAGSTGIVLVNEKTHLQSFLQGAMRMRGLDEEQTIEIIVPDALQGTSLDELMIVMASNEQKQLRDDNYVAAIAKMNNIIRQDLLARIATVDEHDIETRYQWAQAFKRYLIEHNDVDLFEQYGGVARQEQTKLLLEKHRNYLMDDWNQCLASIESSIVPDDQHRIDQALQDVIDASLPNCNRLSTHSTKQGCDLEVEAEKEQEILAVVEKQQEDVCFNPLLEEIKYKHVTIEYIQALLENGDATGGNIFARIIKQRSVGEAVRKTLNNACNLSGQNQIFSPQLFVSDNYYQVYKEQEQMLGFYLKPVHAVLFRMHQNHLTACIVSNQEAEEINVLLRNHNINNVWLSNTQHTCLAGNFPATLLNNAEYHSLIEQVCFFNGECNTLIEQATPFFWLNENTKHKLAYFEKNIMPYRESKDSDLRGLRLVMSNNHLGFKYIQEHAFDELNNLEWNTVFPDAFPADIATWTMLVLAFGEANQRFQKESLSLNSFLDDYLLPPAALPYLQHHLLFLQDVKTVLTVIQHATVTPYNLRLDALSSAQRRILETILHIDIAAMMERHKLNSEPVDEVSCQLFNLDLLMVLRASSIIDGVSLEQFITHNPLINYANMAHIDAEHVLMALLNNPNDMITVEHFERFQSYPQTSATLTAQLDHRHVTLTNIHSVMKSFKGNIEFVLEKIAKNTALNPWQRANLMATILIQYGRDNIFVLAEKYLVPVNELIDESILIDSVSHNDCTEMAYQAILNYLNPSLTVISLIMAAAHSPATWIAVINQPNTTEDIYEALFKQHYLDDETLQALISKTMRTDLLMLIAQRKELSVCVINDLIANATDRALFDVILNEQHHIDGDVLKCMLQSSLMDNDLLTAITHKAVETDVFIAILNHSLVRNRFVPELVELILQKQNTSYIDDVLLKKLIEKTHDQRQLKNIIKHYCTEFVLDAVLMHQNLSQDILEAILTIEQLSPTIIRKLALRNLTSHASCLLIQQTHITDEILEVLANKPSCSSEMLPLIMSNATNKDEVARHLLEKENNIDTTVQHLLSSKQLNHLDDKTLHLLIAKMRQPDRLMLVTKHKTLSVSVINDLVSNAIDKTLLDVILNEQCNVTDDVLRCMLSLPFMDNELLTTITKRAVEQETFLAILNHSHVHNQFVPELVGLMLEKQTASHLNEVLLIKLVEKTQDEEQLNAMINLSPTEPVLNAVLMHQALSLSVFETMLKIEHLSEAILTKLALRIMTRETYRLLLQQTHITDEICRIVINKPSFPVDMLALIASKATATGLLKIILQQAAKPISDDLSSLIFERSRMMKNDDALLSMLALETQNVQLLKQIMAVKSSALPIQNMLKKYPNLSDAALIAILTSLRLKHADLVMISSRVDSDEAIDCLVRQEKANDMIFETIMSRRNQLNNKTINVIIDKAKEPKTLLELIKQSTITEDDLCAIGKHRCVNNMVFHALITRPIAFDQWCEIIRYHIADVPRENQFNTHIRTSIPLTHNDQFDALLSQLFIRAQELIIKSIKENNQACAAEAKDALNLYTAITAINNVEVENKDALKSLIDDYKPKFQDSILVRIYNAIALFIENCVRYVYPKSTYRPQFYATKKETLDIIDKIEKNCDR